MRITDLLFRDIGKAAINEAKRHGMNMQESARGYQQDTT
jgi:hypothetical protein